MSEASQRQLPRLGLIFDVDGTLTRSCRLDQDAFVASFHDAFDLTNVSADWSEYRHVTDSHIAEQILQQADIAATRDNLDRHRQAFLARLRALDDDAFQPVAGAQALLKGLRQRAIPVAAATGGWRASARLKLERAGLSWSYPLVGADDAHTRREIVQKALAQLEGCDQVVLLGDAPWDVECAREMDLPLLAICGGDHTPQQLTRAGAGLVMEQYPPADVLLSLARTVHGAGNFQTK